MLAEIARAYDEDVEPDAKLLLLALASLDDQSETQASPSAWARILGWPEVTVAKGLRRLVEASLVRAVSAAEQARGRPRTEFHWSPAMVVDQLQLSGGQSDGRALERLIPVILGGARVRSQRRPGRNPLNGKLMAPVRTGAGSRLNLKNRLVLIVLLAFADRQGVVRGQGPAKLATCCGMSHSRFNAHVAKLVMLGFIRVYVPGGSGAPMDGVVPGIYFLNLGHPAYGSCAVTSVAYALSAGNAPLEYSSRRSADILMLRRNALRAASRPVKGITQSQFGAFFVDYPSATEDVIHRLAVMLVDAGKHNLLRYLQCLIDMHASYLLTETVKGKPISEKDLEEVRLLILNEISPTRQREPGNAGRLTQAARALLTHFMVQRASDLAEHCLSGIRNYDFILPETFKNQNPDWLQIVPWVKGGDSIYIVVLSAYEKLDAEESIFVFRRPPKTSEYYYSPTYEAEVVANPPFSDLIYKFGLFSR